MKKIFLPILACCLIAQTISAQEPEVKLSTDAEETAIAPSDTTDVSQPELSAEESKAEQERYDYEFDPNVKKTDEWTVVEEGDDEIGHYILETTYEKGIVVASGKWKNWTMTATIGTQFYVGDNDWKAKFGKWWTGPTVDFYANKWVSPNFGLGVGFTYSPFHGLYQVQNTTSAFQTDKFIMEYNGQTLNRQQGHTFNPYVIALIDLDNLILGYKSTRLYNVALYAGGGAIFGLDPIQTRCGATYNMGLFNMFKIYKNLNAMVNLRGSIVSDSFDGEARIVEKQESGYIRRNVPFDITLGLTAGIVYRFGVDDCQKEWEQVGKTTKTYTGYAEAKEQLAQLNEQLAQAKAELEKTQGELDKANSENAELKERNTYNEKIIKQPVTLWYHVQFKIDKWYIQNRELVNLGHIAERIKSAPGTQFHICGYADMQTANPEHNEWLSINRVNEVFKVLTERFGVNPDQLTKDYKGGVDLMFLEDNVLSRCVIIRTEDGKPFMETK